MESEEHENLVIEAIKVIREKSKRPDKASISTYIKKRGLDLVIKNVPDIIDRMLDSAAIYNKPTASGLDSYYVFDIGLDEAKEKMETLSLPANITGLCDQSYCTLDENELDLGLCDSSNRNLGPSVQKNETLATFAAFGNMAKSILDLNKLLKDEREVSSTLRLENLQLRSKVQELELKVNAQLKELELKINSHKNPPITNLCGDNVLFMQPQDYSSSKDVPSAISQELEQQLKAIQFEKHREYLLLESNEEACRKAQENDEQNKAAIDDTIDQSVKRNKHTTKKRKNQNRQSKKKDIVSTLPQHNSIKGGIKYKSQKTQIPKSQVSSDQQKQIESCENRFAVLSNAPKKIVHDDALNRPTTNATEKVRNVENIDSE